MAGEAGVLYWAMPHWPCFLLKRHLSRAGFHLHFPPRYAENLKCRWHHRTPSLSVRAQDDMERLIACGVTRWAGDWPA